MPVYKDEKRNTWTSKFKYKNWKGETKWGGKRGFSTKREALQWENDFKMNLAGDIDMSFEEFIKLYREERYPRIKASTAENKDYIIDDKILPFFKNKKLREISAKDIIKWQNEMLEYVSPLTGKPYSKTYLKTIHNQMSAIMNYAVRFYNLKQNPAAIAGNIGNEDEIEMKFWTLEEYQKFSEVMMKKPSYYYAFQILYWCGLREGEMLALTKRDFNFIEKTITVNKTYQIVRGNEMVTTPKTPKSNRTIIMPDELAEELQMYFSTIYDLRDGDRIFTMTKHGLLHEMEKGSAEAGVKRIRIHDLRHSHVSLLINMGYSAVAIGKRVGHESVDITYRYAHMFPSVQSDMASGLNGLMKAESNASEKKNEEDG